MIPLLKGGWVLFVHGVKIKRLLRLALKMALLIVVPASSLLMFLGHQFPKRLK